MKGRREGGFVAVLVVVALTAVMVVFVVAGSLILNELERDIDLIGERQERRWRELTEEKPLPARVREEKAE